MKKSLKILGCLVVLLFSTTTLGQEAPASEAEDSSATTSAVSPEPVQAPAPDASADKAIKNDNATAADKKFAITIRPPLAIGFPMGSASKGVKQRYNVAFRVPSYLDIGYMITSNLLVGIYGQYGIIGPQVGDNGSDLCFGIQGKYHFLPAIKINPWLGVGIGYEMQTINFSGGFRSDEEYSSSMKGMEFANVQAGLDFRISSVVSMGQFASFSIGQYSSYSTSDPYNGDNSGGIDKKAIHEWMMFGIHMVLHL